MAIRLIEEYPSQVDAPTAEYPHGVPRNKSTPTATDGTPFEQSWFRDQEGFFQGLLETAGITPSGISDTVEQSDYLDALTQISNGVTDIDVGGAADVTISVYQGRISALRLTGTLSGDIDLIVPDVNRLYWIVDDTAGDFSVTAKTELGTGVVLSSGMSVLRCDGTDVFRADAVTTATGEQTVAEALDQRVIYVDTIADLQALPTSGLVDGQGVEITNTLRAGELTWLTGDQSANVAGDEVTPGQGDGGVWVAPASDRTGASGAYKRRYIGPLYLLWYGPDPSGATLSTAAIDAAIGRVIRNETDDEALCLDAEGRANYRYNGSGHTRAAGESKNLKIFATQGQEKTKITCESDVHFLVWADVSSINFKGFEFVGGKSLFISTTPNNNVRHLFVIDEIIFRDQTVCCAGGNSDDMPGWKIKNCYVYQNDDSVLSFALPGLTDESTVSDNTFFGGMLKLGRGANNSLITRNFWPATRDANSANIWIVPQASADNAGAGCDIIDNKFGNEYAPGVPATRRILVAGEDAVAASGDFYERNVPSFSEFDGYVELPNIEDNLFNGWTSNGTPCLEIWCNRPKGLHFGKQRFPGSRPPELVRIGETVVLVNEEYTNSNVIDFGGDAFGITACNRTNFACTLDSEKKLNVDRALQQSGRPGTSYISLLSQTGNGGSTVNASISLSPGELNPNSNTAGEVTFTAANGFLEYKPTLTGFEYTRPINCSVSLKKSSTNPLNECEVVFYRRFGGSTLRALQSRRVILYAEWTTINFTVRSLDDIADALRVTVEPVGYSSGVSDSVIVGNVHVYHSSCDVAVDHITTFGGDAGSWKGGHLVLGNLHIFHDGNDLRVSVGPPTSGTDGALITTAT